MHFGNQLTFADALLLSLISIIVVFAVLVLISVIITILGKVVQEEKSVTTPVNNTPAKPVQQASAPSVDLKSVVNDEHKLVATIVATMEANTNDEDKKYKITSIREI